MQIKNVKVYGLEESIIRSGYPMQIGEPENLPNEKNKWISKIEWDLTKGTQNKDYNRAVKLAKVPSGSGHDNFLKGIIVQFDLQYPEYFSPQLQRYNWIDIVSSQSKMHKITSRELTIDDFAINTDTKCIEAVNTYIRAYNRVEKDHKSHYFQFIISTLPSGYLKWMGISTNYLQLKTIYSQRRHHKLEEWQYFCDWIETLPMSNLITGKDGN